MGNWKEYHVCGMRMDNLKETKEYSDGKLDGCYTSFHENGQLYEKCSYSKDEKHGWSEFYNKNGSLEVMSFYEHGVRKTIFLSKIS